MRTIFSLLLFGLTYPILHGQNRFAEIPIYSTIDWDIQPLDSSGFIFTSYDVRYTVDQERRVDLKRYIFNGQFELQDETSIEIPEGYRLRPIRPIKVWNEDGSYFLFDSYLGEGWLVVHLKPDGTNFIQKIPLTEDMGLVFFDAFEDQVLLGVKIDSKPTVFLYDLKEGRLETLEGFYEKGLQLLDFRVDRENRLITIIKEERKNNERVLMLKNFDYKGQLLRKVELDVPDSIKLNTTIVTNIERGIQFIVGNYTNASLQGTTGSYIAKIDQGGDQQFNFTPYFQMNGYEFSLKEKRSERRRSRAEKRYKKKGRWSTSYRLVHSTPYIVNDQIHVNTNQTVDNTYRKLQMIFKESTEFSGLHFMPVSAWGSLEWINDDEFITLDRGGSMLSISKFNGSEMNNYVMEINTNYLPDGSTNLRVEMIKRWYKNTVLIGFSYFKESKKYYAIASQKID